MFSGRLGFEPYDHLSLGVVDETVISVVQLLALDDEGSGADAPRRPARAGNLPAPPRPYPLPLPPPVKPPEPIYARFGRGPSVSVSSGVFKAIALTRQPEQISFSGATVSHTAGTFQASIVDWRDEYLTDDSTIPLILAALT